MMNRHELTTFIESWKEALWNVMAKTGNGYRRPKMHTPGAKQSPGAKIKREAKAGMIGKRNGRRL